MVPRAGAGFCCRSMMIGCDGVARGHGQHLDDAQRVQMSAAGVESHQGPHADDTESHPGQPYRCQIAAVAEQGGEDRPDDRHGGQQQAGQRAGDAHLGMAQQHPGDAHFEDREDGGGPPVAQSRPECAGVQGQREEHHQCQCSAAQHHGRRRDLGDGDLDEEVGQAPDDRHRHEQGPGLSGHVVMVMGARTVRGRGRGCGRWLGRGSHGPDPMSLIAHRGHLRGPGAKTCPAASPAERGRAGRVDLVRLDVIGDHDPRVPS